MAQRADVCIICALEEEADAVERVICERCQVVFSTHATEDGRFIYRSTTITNNKQEKLTLVLLCQTRPGPVSAALDLRTQLQLFQPCFVGMSGICAGDKRHLHLGDLAVAENAYHFEEGKVTYDETGMAVHQPEGITYGPAESLLHAVRTFGAWKTPVAELKKSLFGNDELPRCVMTLFGSGMAVRGDDPFPVLQRQHRKTWALDMEAASFYLALRATPFVDGLVVKGVVDYADSSKDDAFHDFAARASALYLLTFIQEHVTWDRLRRSRDQTFSSLSSTQRQNRERLLKRVRAIWIEGLLEQSLHRAAWIDLHLQEQPDALENPWQLQVQELGRESSPLPVDTSIVQVYDEAGGELLLLGEPGSGKTTLLLQLARALLDRAQSDERQQMPVLFNLSSWAAQRKPLTTWLREELKTKYQVPRQIGQHWIETNQILPLLDGLDEVVQEARTACVEAITLYYHQYANQTGTPLVICCRSEEYRALSLSLPLQRAVSILPLTDEQINAYLSWSGGQLEALQQALCHDRELYELAHRPLMLSIFTLVYQGTTLPLPQFTQEQTLRVIFERYVTRMLTRRGQLQRWTREQFLSWLTSMARHMHQQQQSTFSVEDLQADWLQYSRQSLYRSRFIQLITLVGLLLIWPPGVPADLRVRHRLSGKGVRSAVINAVWTYLLTGELRLLLICGLIGLPAHVLFGFLIVNLVMVLALVLVFWIRRPKGGDWYFLRRNWPGIRLFSHTLFVLIIGLFGVQGGGPLRDLRWGLFIVLFTWRIIWLIGERFSKPIQPIEAIQWSWKNALEGLKITVRRSVPPSRLLIVLVCVFIGGFVALPLVAASTVELESATLSGFALVFVFLGLLVGGGLVLMLFGILVVGGLILMLLVSGLVGGLVGGLSASQLVERADLSPNEGIRRSGKNGLIGGLVGGLAGGLVGWPPGGPVGGLVGMLLAGMSIGLLTGLRPFIQHFVLRFWLWCTKTLPWDLIPFLDEAAERLLLRKVGGSYIFVHRLLLDYLAAVEEPVSSEGISSERKA